MGKKDRKQASGAGAQEPGEEGEMPAGMLSGDRLGSHLWVDEIPLRRAHGNPFQYSCLENHIDRVA